MEKLYTARGLTLPAVPWNVYPRPRLVRERCDYLVSIPMSGHVDSLNAGVAAGILLFEKRRQESVKQ